MPLDLSKWNKKPEANAETANEQASQSNLPVQPSKELHNAPSQSTEKPSATSILQTLAPLNLSQASPAIPKAVANNDSASVPNSDDPKVIKYQEISDRVTELQTAIHSAHPRMPGILQEIWKTLHSYPEQVSLLEEDQMRMIINGLEKVVDTDLANVTIKAATSGKKGKGQVTMDTLGF